MTLGACSDDELMARLAQGEMATLEEIIRRYSAPLFRFLLTQIGDWDGAQDLLQELFLAVYESRGRYRPEG